MQNKFNFFIFFLLIASISVSYCNNSTPEPSFGVCRRPVDYHAVNTAGYDFIELSVGDFLAPSRNDSTFFVNLEKMKQLNAKIISCHSFLPGNLRVTGPETFHKEILEWAEITFLRAQLAGVRYIVFGSGGARRVPEGFDKQEATLQFVELCKRMAPIAQKYDVTVVLEPLNKGETNLINSLSEGAAIVKAVGHPNIQLLCDIFHMLRDDEPAEEIIKYGEFIRHCHIAEKEVRSAPGVKGDDFSQYFNALKQINYTGCISIETGRWDDWESGLVPALQYMKKQYGIIK